jgi:hypothetical protein
MKKRSKITPKKLDSVMSLLRETPSEPVGEHLTIAEFKQYASGTLGVREIERLDAHLLSCSQCAETMERRLVRHMLITRLAGMLQAPHLWPRLGLSARPVRSGATGPRDGQTADGTLRWRSVEEENQTLTISFGTSTLDLEGTRLRLTLGTWQREVVLDREDESSDQLLAEITVTREERLSLPADAELHVEFVD